MLVMDNEPQIIYQKTVLQPANHVADAPGASCGAAGSY